jgi:hypothetical protein
LRCPLSAQRGPTSVRLTITCYLCVDGRRARPFVRRSYRSLRSDRPCSSFGRLGCRSRFSTERSVRRVCPRSPHRRENSRGDRLEVCGVLRRGTSLSLFVHLRRAPHGQARPPDSTLTLFAAPPPHSLSVRRRRCDALDERLLALLPRAVPQGQEPVLLCRSDAVSRAPAQRTRVSPFVRSFRNGSLRTTPARSADPDAGPTLPPIPTWSLRRRRPPRPCSTRSSPRRSWAETQPAGINVKQRVEQRPGSL